MITFQKSPVFSGELGERLYKKVCDYIDTLSLGNLINRGVLVGFSGGPDSVFLLEFLNEYKKRTSAPFKILAVHVNHSIRGEEADADENFSYAYANSLDVEFISKKVDAKAYAKENKKTLEEAARDLRYSVFQEIIQGRNDISSIAIAHNANDNFETVLFNMFRGAGLRGISGITPIRGNIIRPILSVTKSEILDLLSEKRIEYATDSTNFSTDYTRNYIRHEIIPHFSKLSQSPEAMITKLTESLRLDNDFIEREARDFYSKNSSNGTISTKTLSALHPALLARVISYLAEPYGISLERVHITSIIDLLPKGNFKLTLPSGYEFTSESGVCYVSAKEADKDFYHKLSKGENKFEEFEDIIVVSDTKLEKSFSNVYKIAIQASINFDIINSELYIRSKQDGDSYKFGGMTRKLKKLYNDKSIPPSQRQNVPLLCDKEGIVWAPGFKVRDGAVGTSVYVAICKPTQKSSQKKRSFYIPK